MAKNKIEQIEKTVNTYVKAQFRDEMNLFICEFEKRFERRWIRRIQWWIITNVISIVLFIGTITVLIAINSNLSSINESYKKALTIVNIKKD